MTSVFRNSPELHANNGEAQVKRYVHSPLSVEHYGITANITEHGRVVFSKIAGVVKDPVTSKETVEYDEVDIPASLIFKMANLLKATRKVKYVSLSDIKSMPAVDGAGDTV